MPTLAEQTAYAHMQARIIALMLQHDQQGFRRYIDSRVDAAEEGEAATRPYRDLGVLFFLGAQLFEDILPRIVRRLSFESPRHLVVEEPPARGRIRWERTLDAVWAERPGEPPLVLHTRQRRRDFATAENLLTVVTLLEYEAGIRTILHGDRTLIGAQALRHPLNDLADRCRRELAFPQFAGLLPQARRILDGAQGGVATLEARVAAHAAPGGNRAYQGLLAWRVRWRTLQLLRRAPGEETNDVLGADPDRDNYLYQLWIFYELADLLQHDDRLLAIDTQPGQMALRFSWGTTGCVYMLRHDQSVPKPVSRWSAQPNPKDVPGVRPDFYLYRIDPPPTTVSANGVQIWREPGVIWDAKYYRERESERTPSSPVKRMIADLTLLGESYGVLLFAFLTGATNATSDDDDTHQQRLAPAIGIDQTLTPLAVAIRQLRPALDADRTGLHGMLRMLLDNAHARLAQPRIPACHGVFLDSLSAAERTGLTDRYGTAISDEPSDLLLCPKPHIGAWRVDLVSRARHCCQDARLCHIVGQAQARPPLRPARDARELLRELQRILEPAEVQELDDATVSAIAQQVEAIGRQFAHYRGIAQRIAIYEQRVRDMGLDQAFDRLSKAERESLAIGAFLVEQLDEIAAGDFSAPAIHLSSVMELEVQRRVFACPGLVGPIAEPRNQTLGKLPWMRRDPEATEGNWTRIVTHVAHHWNEQIDPEDPDRIVPFDAFVARALSRIAQLRNQAAHTHPVSRKEYSELQRLMFQGGSLASGALNALLLAWRS